ncbi:MAG: hypothetical protein ACOCV8_02405 [Spirochaetota bacterium]
MSLLQPESAHKIVYKKSFFEYAIFTIIPKEDQDTLLTENIMYNGRRDVYVQVRSKGFNIYNAYIRNVKKIEHD